MILYYIFMTIISLGMVVITYFAPNALSFLGNEVNEKFANIGMALLRITLLVKPIFSILMKYSELKTLTIRWLRDYLKTIKWRSVKWLGMVGISCIYFLAGIGMKWRRLLGITTFLAIFAHAGMRIATRVNTNFTLLTQLQKFWILAWYIWLLMLFIGYITSNNYSIRLFKKNWKLIQYSAYLALVFALFHLAFLNFWEYVGHYVVFVLYILLKLIEKKKINWL